jgi:hypothetical protein
LIAHPSADSIDSQILVPKLERVPHDDALHPAPSKNGPQDFDEARLLLMMIHALDGWSRMILPMQLADVWSDVRIRHLARSGKHAACRKRQCFAFSTSWA